MKKPLREMYKVSYNPPRLYHGLNQLLSVELMASVNFGMPR
jgi:hypothetical protein